MLPDGTVTELNTVTDFLFRIGVAMPTAIPRTTLWFDVQWTPFANASKNAFTGYSFGPGEVDANLPTFVYGFLIDLITAQQTGGWLTLGFDPLLVANPAGQPDDQRDYTHKLELEARLGLGVFNWLPKGNWLRSVKGYALLDYIATGLPQAGDEVPKGARVFLSVIPVLRCGRGDVITASAQEYGRFRNRRLHPKGSVAILPTVDRFLHIRF